MKHIYIDAGCYDGDTIRSFNDWKFLAYPEDTIWEIYGFDASPQFKWGDNAIYEQKAVWIEDGTIEFANCIGEHNMGSTVMKEKDHWKIGEKIQVECFDFSKWLMQFRGEHVIIKMDIEGAEMPVLQKMIDDGTDDIAQITFVEWHDHKLSGSTYDRSRLLREYRGKIITWK